jgi:uncharacterized membrane protein YphA (DoxX/SURF4 family)
MTANRPGLVRRIDRSGVPLLVFRLVLGVLFIGMGLAKTGVLKTQLERRGLASSNTVQTLKAHGLIDLAQPTDFLKLLREYDMVPQKPPVLMNSIAALLPWVEVVCGAMLILGIGVRGASLLLFVLLLGFTGAVAYRALNIYNAQDIAFCAIKFDCGCGAGEVFICNKLVENSTLCLLALLTALSGSRRFCLLPRLIPQRQGVVPAPAAERISA